MKLKGRLSGCDDGTDFDLEVSEEVYKFFKDIFVTHINITNGGNSQCKVSISLEGEK